MRERCDLAADVDAGELHGGVADIPQQRLAAPGREVGGAFLIVGIDEENITPGMVQEHGEIGRDGGLATAAFDPAHGLDHRASIAFGYAKYISRISKRPEKSPTVLEFDIIIEFSPDMDYI